MTRPPNKLDSLYTKYPTAYARPTGRRETFAMFGFECGPGWFDILDRLGAVLELHKVSCAQVKEKFGMLRVYWHADYLEPDADDAVRAAIDAAEAESASVCEQCGDLGGETISLGGWLKTLCSPCYEADRKAMEARRRGEP